MIADLGRLGVQALSEAEQRQLLGGGFWETAGMWAGTAVAAVVNAAEGIFAQLENYENPRYNGSWQG